MQGPVTTTMGYKKMKKPKFYLRVTFLLVREIKSHKSKEIDNHGKNQGS